MNENIKVQVREIAEYLASESTMLTTAESCTGGLVAKQLTDLAGSSQWFDRGFITYSNQSKVEMLGVNMETLARFGAVSEQVAESMARGALSNSHANYSLSITGIAGPAGGNDEKPVGTVCFGWAKQEEIVTKTAVFSGDREQIRCQASRYSMLGLLNYFLTKN